MFDLDILDEWKTNHTMKAILIKTLPVRLYKGPFLDEHHNIKEIMKDPDDFTPLVTHHFGELETDEDWTSNLFLGCILTDIKVKRKKYILQISYVHQYNNEWVNETFMYLGKQYFGQRIGYYKI